MTQQTQQGKSAWTKILITIAILVAAGALMWSQLPRGPYPTDLARIGQGRPALVLAYDIQSMGGMAGMELLDKLRDEYADRVEFLVADLGVPQGRQFAQSLGAISGTVAFLSADGAHLQTMHPPLLPEALRQAVHNVAVGPTK